MNDLNRFQEGINYRFKNINYLRLALTHSSYANENELKKGFYNERIEFLGDAILEFVSSDFLYRNYPDMKEGEMTKLRANLVCEEALSLAAMEIELGKYLFLGKGEENTNGRNRKSLLCDAFEAVIGAIYLDSGIDAAKQFIKRFVLSDIEKKKDMLDSKTALQEIVQAKYGVTVKYEVIEESGPEHNKLFTVAVFLKDEMMGKGTGHSKKEAAKEAAYRTIQMLK